MENRQAEPIYLELDLEASKRYLNDYRILYNGRMKREHPADWKGRTLKATHMRTAEAILKQYWIHCFKNRTKTRPHDTRFEVAQSFLMELTANGSDSTIRRHDQRLKESGFLDQRIYHGDMCAIEYVINPEFLVPKIDVETLAKLGEMKIAFSAGSTAIFAECGLTSTSGTPQDAYNKYVTAVVDFAKKGAGNFRAVEVREIPSLITTGRSDHKRRGMHAHGGADKPQGAIPGRAAEPVKPAEAQALLKEVKSGRGATYGLDDLIFRIWNFIVRVLYPGINLSPAEMDAALEYLRSWYYEDKDPVALHNRLIESVILKRYHLDKRPETFMPPPSMWLNPFNSYGLVYMLEKALPYVKNKRKEQEQYYGNVQLLAKVFREYYDNPTIEEYDKQVRKLRKLEDNNKLLDIFNVGVLNPDQVKTILTLKNLHYEQQKTQFQKRSV